MLYCIKVQAICKNKTRLKPAIMEFEWDEQKNQECIQKHGISFKRASLVFDDPDRIERIDV